ncbi:hypothetical protein [Psychrobacter sp. DAB_AL43B]|uniref:hypothetical protein n=1 Tax=Psychrobacter sp. DAB_AL43B TaxID=1028416 RepID=UPI0009A648F0|nr:hypothetical protein [Psychrobacter sp. DAB_AL43B]SLJ84467.1 hypothetical protein DABAL43B_1271 [Psychrobacter sp. DAB_AL43B]
MCQKTVTELSPEYRGKAREIRNAISQCILTGTQTKITEVSGADKNKVGRFVGPDLDLIATMFAVLGLKVVPEDYIYCDPEIVDATAVFFQHAASSPDFMRRLLSGHSLPKGVL